MDMDKAKELYENYLNGNISDFKKELNKLTKKELLDFIYYVDRFGGDGLGGDGLGGDGLYLCSKYLEAV